MSRQFRLNKAQHDGIRDRGLISDMLLIGGYLRSAKVKILDVGSDTLRGICMVVEGEGV